MIRGRNGVFDVRLDGQIVYSKWETARFPQPGEVVASLRDRLGT
ncbi:MAG: Rdx family protein [Holophagales bacterium]|nr:MAG: Rdx family protein [Holophagales bacterium]